MQLIKNKVYVQLYNKYTCMLIFLKLKSGSHLLKKLFISYKESTLKDDEKCFFYFNFKSSFRSHGIKILSWLLDHVEKTALLERYSKFMPS